jgi:hypothetical protein
MTRRIKPRNTQISIGQLGLIIHREGGATEIELVVGRPRGSDANYHGGENDDRHRSNMPYGASAVVAQLHGSATPAAINSRSTTSEIEGHAPIEASLSNRDLYGVTTTTSSQQPWQVDDY